MATKLVGKATIPRSWSFLAPRRLPPPPPLLFTPSCQLLDATVADLHARFGAQVARCEAIIGYRFVNKKLCAEALNAASDEFAPGPVLPTTAAVDDAAAPQAAASIPHLAINARLAVYGDAVAAAYLCGLWERRPHLKKRDWTELQKDRLENKTLWALGREHGLESCVVLNRATPAVSDRTMANTVEAILGAVRKDGGEPAMGAVMERLGLTDHVLLKD